MKLCYAFLCHYLSKYCRAARGCSVLVWKDKFLANLVPGRLRSTMINSHTLIPQTIPIHLRSLTGPDPACKHQLFQWLKSQSTRISKRISQILRNPPPNTEIVQKPVAGSQRRDCVISFGKSNHPRKGLIKNFSQFHNRRVRPDGTTPQIPTFPRFAQMFPLSC